MKDLFSYTAGDSVLHKMNPVAKIFLAFAVCIAAFVSDSLLYLFALLCFDLLLGAAGKVPQKALSILRGLLKIGFFLFLLQLLFIRSGSPVFLFVTDQGLLTAAKVVLRLTCACLPLTLMLAVTKLNDLSEALVKVAHLPYQYAFTLTTAIRFIPVFMEDMAGIMEAQTARGVEFDTKNVFQKLRLIVPLCAPLLLSSVRKADSAAAAAEARGFALRTRNSGYRDFPLLLRDHLSFLLGIALIVVAALLNPVLF